MANDKKGATKKKGENGAKQEVLKVTFKFTDVQPNIPSNYNRRVKGILAQSYKGSNVLWKTDETNVVEEESKVHTFADILTKYALDNKSTSKYIDKNWFLDCLATLDAFNNLAYDRKVIKASDGMQYDISDYKVTAEFARLIIPARIALKLDDVYAKDIALCHFSYSLGLGRVLTPEEFERVQLALYSAFRVGKAKMSFVSVVERHSDIDVGSFDYWMNPSMSHVHYNDFSQFPVPFSESYFDSGYYSDTISHYINRFLNVLAVDIATSAERSS